MLAVRFANAIHAVNAVRIAIAIVYLWSSDEADETIDIQMWFEICNAYTQLVQAF